MRVISQKRVRKWESVAGVCCFGAGILAPVLGCLLTVIDWIVVAPLHPWIHVAATSLFIVAIPLILFAGFCFDWAERGIKGLADEPKQAQRGAAALAQIAIIATILGISLLTPAVLHAQQTIRNDTSLLTSHREWCSRLALR